MLAIASYAQHLNEILSELSAPLAVAREMEKSGKDAGTIKTATGWERGAGFLADIADFAAFNEVYAKYFTSKPARSCVAVKDLPKGVLCEIEAIAEA